MMKKKKIAIIFGGKSAEHEVSLQSAFNIMNSLNKRKYEVIPIHINKAGKWMLCDLSNRSLFANDAKLLGFNKLNKEISLSAHPFGSSIDINNNKIYGTFDVAFPVLHGPYGEDGSMQGFLKLAGIPFVGSGVLGSAIGMDKDVTKRLLKESKISIPKFIAIRHKKVPPFKKIVSLLGLPIFVKPANLGSSVGVSKVKNEKELGAAIHEAFKYDTKILIEEAIVGREIECSVLGNEKVIVSLPGEIITKHEFYSYNAKYVDENGAVLEIPAKLTKAMTKKIQKIAIKAFKVLNCEGMARVDFFLKRNGDVLVNEINTIPGFTSVSMYPKLWEASGVSREELLDRLAQLAISRFNRDRKLKTSFS